MTPAEAAEADTGSSGDEYDVPIEGAGADADAVSDDVVPLPPRTVLDFESRKSLRDALRDFNKRGSVCSTNSCPFYENKSDEDEDGGEGDDLDARIDGDFGRFMDLPPDPSATDWVTANLKMENSVEQTVEAEAERLLVLKSYLMLDSGREPAFERLTTLCQRFFDVPIALISLVDIGRQWFMSNRGLGDVRETPRKLAFCAHAIQSTDDMLIVPDATADPRFRTNGLVTGEPHIRFYAGAPLICPEGYKLGTLCMIDRKTRPNGLSLGEKQTLREFAALVMEAMVHRRRDRMDLANDRSKVVACLARDLKTPLRVAQQALETFKSVEKAAEEKEGEAKKKKKDAIASASTCLDVMESICDETIRTFRSDLLEETEKKKLPPVSPSTSVDNQDGTDIVAAGTAADDSKENENSDVVNVSKLIQNLRTVVDQACPPDSPPITIDVDPSVPPDFMSDGLKIFRSALNILLNAAQNTPKNGPRGTGSIKFRIYAREKVSSTGKAALVFECEDTGRGVSPDDRNRLFLPFPNGKNKNGSSGLGLGLYSVAVNISSLGGRYGYRPRSGWDNSDSDPAEGSIFWFSVPLVVCYSTVLKAKEESAADKKPGSSSSPPSSSSIQNKKKMLSLAASDDYDSNEVFDAVSRALETKEMDHEDDQIAPKQPPMATDQPAKFALVIDDSVVIRKAIGRALTKQGFHVKYAVDGMQGLTALQSSKFDVVFCDFLMPVLDGLDCIEQYRSWESRHRPKYHQKIVGLSAHASDADVKRGAEAGMDSFVSKNSKLQDVLQKAIDSSEKFKVTSKRGGGSGAGVGVGVGIGTETGTGTGTGARSETGLSSSIMNLPMSGLPLHPSYSHLARGGRAPMSYPSVGSSKQALSAIHQAATQTRSGTFPGASQSGAAVIPQSSRPNETPPGLECLIVEDSRSALKTLVRAVESAGWKANVADDEDHALTLLKSKRWGVALIDGETPGCNDVSIVAKFREWESKNRTVRQNNLIVMRGKSTAENGTGTASPCHSGFDGILLKPIKADDVSKLLEKAALRRFDREEIQRK